LSEAQAAREQRTDWYTARIVAMLAAVNSKKEKYQPVKWMANGGELMRKTRAEKEPPTGDEIMAAFKRSGIPIIDRRKRIA
jgi:hypothetical protein